MSRMYRSMVKKGTESQNDPTTVLPARYDCLKTGVQFLSSSRRPQ